MRWIVAILVIACAWGCTLRAADTRTLCNPGDNIFCRCELGQPGTKACAADGAGFGSCRCRQQSDVTESAAHATSTGSANSSASSSTGGAGAGAGSPSASSSSGSTSSSASSTTSGAGGAAGNIALLAPCDGDTECASKKCDHGYCTKACEKFSDCPWPESECVGTLGSSICMPTCKSVTGCKKYLAPPSMCGYAKAIDDFAVTVCADWGAQHQLPPVGATCADHSGCNLGYDKKQRVCNAKSCAAGCFASSDCPSAKTCSQSGTLGTCK